MRTTEEMEVLKSVRDKLKECKDEWLEKNAKGQPALGVLTVQQILDNAVQGVTTWDFRIEEQWREEVNKFHKPSGQYQFDGYIYHVRGHLSIEGIGTRTQYGSKIAIGGKDNQNSAYKSAASDCLKKCASLFGVGSSVYAKVKVETEEEQWSQQNQQNASYDYNQQQIQNQQQHNQQQQVQQPQQITLPNGDIQQGEYIWPVNGTEWVHQTQYQVQNGGQYPTAGLTPQAQNNWAGEVMRQYDPQGYNQMMTEEQRMSAQMDETIRQANEDVKKGVDYPFENVTPPPAQEQKFEAQPQAETQRTDFQAQPLPEAQAVTPVGAPVENAGQPAPPKQEDPLDKVIPQNPWDNPANIQEMNNFQAHKQRLGMMKDADILPHVREYFKDEKAGIDYLTPETLVGFNAYLQNIQA